MNLREAVKACRGCDLYKYATQAVFSKGPQNAQIALVGEVPGDQEDLKGAPFVGPAGEVLDRALSEVRLNRAELYVTNAENDTSQSTDWVQFVFHRVCDRSTGGHCGAYSISPSKLDAFLTFLDGEVTAGRVVVRTTAQVIDQGTITYHPDKCDPATGTNCIGPPPS